MPRTPFQQKVIDTRKTNLIVSAGAGSGKTSTLTDRIITIIENGTSINNLLVLTFTNAASQEMKERIRSALVKANMTEELTYLDSSYICTFDSFALSIVKKYYYVLGLDKHIDICEDSLIQVVTKALAREVLDEAYLSNDNAFKDLATDFLVKDDKIFLDAIISINNELNKLVNKEKYILDYKDNFYNEDKLTYIRDLYDETVKDKLFDVINAIKLVFLESDETVGEKINEIITVLENCQTYEDIYDEVMNLNFPRKNKNCSENYSNVRKILTDELKKIKTLLRYEYLNEYDEEYYQMIANANVLMRLVYKLHKKVENYKKERKLYTFYDIAKMAIDLLSEHSEIREELKSKFKEIMIDEYQDTSDIQETLINLLSTNNVCVVGDIKQSIYRFRNANPIIFKEKYDTYGKIPNSSRIDLLDNFRSREEVVSDVNFLFSELMRDKAGGADYKKDHMMIYGNKLYDKYKANQDYHMEVLNYNGLIEKHGKAYSKGEIEAFVIANDIKKKIESKFQIFDTKKIDEGLRDAKYSDFCILMPVSTNFNIFKKVFEYFGIPLAVLKKDSLIEGDEILTLKNLFLFIDSIYKNEFDENSVETKYQYLSIARSFLYEENDEISFDILENNKIKETEIYKKSYEIAKKLNVISIAEFTDLVIKDFDIIKKFNKKGGVSKMLVESEYLVKLSNSLINANIGIEGFVSYLNDVLESKLKIEFDSNDYATAGNAVKMMNIHKSKGLEFQVCYLASNYSKYNEKDNSAKYLFDANLGLICPIYDFGVKETFVKSIYKYVSQLEERAEKIRLFYVAVTRAKEKVVIVDNVEYDRMLDGFEWENDILRATSFSKLLHGMYPKILRRIENVDIKLTKDYFNIKDTNIEMTNKDTISVNEYFDELEEAIDEVHFSKREYKLINKETKEKMEFGNRIHEIMECLDFKSDNLVSLIDKLNIEDYYKNKIKKFFENDILSNIKNGKVYKEYKFYTNDLESMGIIDLMIEYEDYIDIIDYKLKNVSDEAYLKQLHSYKNYIETVSNKKANIYLYSIIDENLLKLV